MIPDVEYEVKAIELGHTDRILMFEGQQPTNPSFTIFSSALGWAIMHLRMGETIKIREYHIYKDSQYETWSSYPVAEIKKLDDNKYDIKTWD